jgi:hypothetical protein
MEEVIPCAAFHPNRSLSGWIGIFIHTSRVKLWVSPTDMATVKPAPKETHYSCKPISDLKFLLKKTPSGK